MGQLQLNGHFAFILPDNKNYYKLKDYFSKYMISVDKDFNTFSQFYFGINLSPIVILPNLQWEMKLCDLPIDMQEKLKNFKLEKEKTKGKLYLAYYNHTYGWGLYDAIMDDDTIQGVGCSGRRGSPSIGSEKKEESDLIDLIKFKSTAVKASSNPHNKVSLPQDVVTFSNGFSANWYNEEPEKLDERLLLLI